MLYPHRAPKPRNIHLVRLVAGTELLRIYDRSKYNVKGKTFRSFGPLERFDHHSFQRDGIPRIDPSRRVWYGALEFSTSLVEVFGETRLIEYPNRRVAVVTLRRDVELLDLANGAMAAGTVAALAATTDRHLSQSWSRHFYRHTRFFRNIDGLYYNGAHNNGLCMMLYERAEDAVQCPENSTRTLADPRWRPEILSAIRDYNLNE